MNIKQKLDEYGVGVLISLSLGVLGGWLNSFGGWLYFLGIFLMALGAFLLSATAIAAFLEIKNRKRSKGEL